MPLAPEALAAGQRVIAAGQPATTAGQHVTAAGQHVTAGGQHVTAVGQPATAAGQHTTAAGLIAADYRWLAASCAALNVRVVNPGPRPPTASAQARFGRPARLIDGRELAEDPSALEAFVAAEAARIRVHRQLTVPVPGHVAASRALHGYAWPVSMLMSGAWFLWRRVPRLEPGDVRVDVATHTLEVTAGRTFACLPDDPAAALAGARVSDDEETLRADLRAAVADHLRPLLAALAQRIRRGPRALWGMVADDLISGIWHLGRMRGEETAAVRAATALLPHAIPPYPGGAAFRTLHGGAGRRHATRTNLGCCLHYAIGATAPCLTCPRTCDAERLKLLEPEPEPEPEPESTTDTVLDAC